MFGKIEIFQTVVIGLALLSTISDLAFGKIYNAYVIPALIAGVLFSIYTLHWHGLASSLLGAFCGLLFYGWMYAIGVLGAGDVKLLMAFGAWGGSRFAFEVAVLAILVGGVMGLFAMLLNGKLENFLKRGVNSLMSMFIRELEFIPFKIDKKGKIPFGVAISVAAVWICFWHPFEGWEALLWR